MSSAGSISPRIVQRVPAPETHAFITTSAEDAPTAEPSLDRLIDFAQADGDISHLLTTAKLTELGVKVVREWRIDAGSRQDWLERAQRSLDIAAQERAEEDQREPLFDDGANIYSPLLTIGSLAFAAKASPDLIRGDQVVGIKVLTPPVPPQPIQPPPPPPQSPQEAAQLQQAAQQQAMQQTAQAAQRENATAQQNARGERVKFYLNYLIFYRMDGWEDETDQLLHEAPVVGAGFKKVYMSSTSLCSDYVSALRLTVHKDTKSIYRCPRLTEDFEVYPYEIEERILAGRYRRTDLPPAPGDDPQKPRKFLEQHRMEDLDGDGLAEPYIVTVDEDTMQVQRVECAFTMDDVMTRDGQVTRIDRWLPYAAFRFLPDMKGGFYGTGYGKLLEPIIDSIDATINQLLDAGTAQIAGGGFIASGVRMQGSGQGGVVTFQPGEYPVVNADGATLRESIWERTIPNPSEVSFKLMELMMDWGKNIMSTQDVMTGDAPSTAPVGTTFALQNQALMSYRACFKRMFRGFKDEFRLMYRTLKRGATDRERKEYQELTGGDFDQDFGGDGTDIQPIADPAVVTKMQKMARNQATMQLAESELGQAAGMTQPKQAQKIIKDILGDMDVDEVDAYVGDVQPNPEVIAKAQDMQASAGLKQAQAQAVGPKLQIEAQNAQTDAAYAQIDAKKAMVETGLTQAKTVRELGLAAVDTHELHKEADRIAQTGSVADAESLVDPAEEAAKDRAAKPKTSTG
jgi:chaperonin GroES